MKNKENVLNRLNQVENIIKNIDYNIKTNRKEESIQWLENLTKQIEQIKDIVSIEQSFYKDDQHLW